MNTSSSKGPLYLTLCAAIAGMVGCNVHGVEPLEGNIYAEQTDLIVQGSGNAVDILWVVDSSASMCQEQASLRENFDAFVELLAEVGVDFRLAVVTTDMLAPEARGRFQNVPDGRPGLSEGCMEAPDISACPTPERAGGFAPLVIGSDDPRYRGEDGALDVALVKRDFGCNATVGVRGDGLAEMGFEAARRALSPELLGGPNAGFLRDDAHLAIVFLTDENDCSHDGSLPAGNGGNCEWEEHRLTPVADYIDFFESLKPDDPGKVIMAGIFAPDTGARYEHGEHVLASCTSSSGEGYSGYRYEQLLGAFENSASANICAPERFGEALEGISSLILTSIEGSCLKAPLPTCETDADCVGGACATRGAGRLCDALRVQVEVTRPLGVAGLDGARCDAIKDGRQRCILDEEVHYTIDYNDTSCGVSKTSVQIMVNLGAGDALGVRYPRAVSLR